MLVNDSLLRIASNVLEDSTIKSVLRSGSYHSRGWRILDRWAFYSPDRLLALEAQGEIVLLIRLLEQQNIEHDALISAAGLAQRANGLSEHEVLMGWGISTEL
ncbi:hypothetical protein [Stutzerimonas zhaodongensis]|jgi:hypothetical protein|uniref:hypothetical protein n=1 Tax=Stutzerimonas zhaodongensis TaxID=1176257 RepID=UPI001F4D74E7|nr:hypothetical protein [Stutzerimonas zhaodongensis]UNG18642.1 hypothetical protein MKP10_23185 [Stutzerimonas zhaodongensis]